MNTHSVRIVLAILGPLASAQAATKLPLYDDFSAADLNRTKWIETEAARYVNEKGRLVLQRQLFGGTASDAGANVENFVLNVAAPTQARSLKATITVTAVKQDESCAANATVGSSYARLIATYFNVRPGGPLPGDRTGDVGAQVRLSRASNSTDAAGVLRVQGVPFVCTNADCSASAIYASVADLGQIQVGTALVAQLNWDKKNNRFQFIRDKLPPVDVSYSDDDNAAPVLSQNTLGLRNIVPNCHSGSQVKAGIAALFDDVGIAP
jgi:hypothetical protein